MQILADNNFGLIPAHWRPRELSSFNSLLRPFETLMSFSLSSSRRSAYGDVDNRVRAIAREVFGLKTITWNPGE